jgi:predicted acylesterase/phospholipase RssA
MSSATAATYPKRLVFSGGGTRCLVFASCLVELQQAGRLEAVESAWGTSAGALVAALFLLAKSAVRVRDILYSANFTKFINIDPANLLLFSQAWGLDSGATLTEELERLLELTGAGNSRLRLRDIPAFTAIVTDLTTREILCCNSTAFPDMMLVDAIRASMCLPFFFTPFRAPNGHVWVDGGIQANLAWDVLPDDAARSESLGFAFEPVAASQGPRTLHEYLFSIAHFNEPKKIRSLQSTWTSNILWCARPPYPLWFVRFRAEDYELVDAIGQAAAATWLSAATPTSSGPPAMPAAPPVCAPPHTPLQEHPAHHTTELLGSQIPCGPSVPVGSSRPQWPQSSPASRRWSV